MNKKLIRLTEGDLHRIVRESVKRILMEEREDIDRLSKSCNAFASVQDIEDHMIDLGWFGMSWDDFNSYNHNPKLAEYVKWTHEVHFVPTFYFDCSEDGDIYDYDNQGYDEFIRQVNKLDTCPVFTDEEKEELKRFLIDEVEEAIETNRIEPNDSMEPEY